MTLNEALTKIGNDIISDARSTLQRQGHRATGKLMDTMKAVVNKSELTFELEAYARYVDKGRKAGKIWTKGSGNRKDYMKFRKDNGYPPVAALMKTYGIDSSYAFAISHIIQREGIKPSLFFTNAFEAYAENLDEVLDKYIDTLLEDL